MAARRATGEATRTEGRMLADVLLSEGRVHAV